MSTEVAVHDGAGGSVQAAMQLAAPDPHVIAALMLTAVCGGTVKGIAGFGAAIVNLLIWLLLTACGVDAGPMQQLVLLNLLSLLTDTVPLLFLTRPWKHADARIVLSMAAGSVVGLPLGIWLLVYLPVAAVQLATAGALLLLLIMQTAQPLCRIVKARYSRPPCKSLGQMEVAMCGSSAGIAPTGQLTPPCCSHADLTAKKGGTMAIDAQWPASAIPPIRHALALKGIGPQSADGVKVDGTFAVQQQEDKLTQADAELFADKTAMPAAAAMHMQTPVTLVGHLAADMPPSISSHDGFGAAVHTLSDSSAWLDGGDGSSGTLGGHNTANPVALQAPTIDYQEQHLAEFVHASAGVHHAPLQAVAPPSMASAGVHHAPLHAVAPPSMASCKPSGATALQRPGPGSDPGFHRMAEVSAHQLGQEQLPGVSACHSVCTTASLDRGHSQVPSSSSSRLAAHEYTDHDRQPLMHASSSSAGTELTRLELTTPRQYSSRKSENGDSGGAESRGHHTSHPAAPPPSYPALLHPPLASGPPFLPQLSPADMTASTVMPADVAQNGSSAQLPLEDLEGQPLLGGHESQQSRSFGGCEMNEGGVDGIAQVQQGWRGHARCWRAVAWQVVVEQRARWWSREGLILVLASTLSGFASGLLNGLTSLGGPAMIALFLYLKLPIVNVRANGACGPWFIAPIAIANFVRYGLLHASAWRLYVGFICGSASGVGLGCLLVRFLNVNGFAHVMRALMLMCCILLFGAGLGFLPTHKKN